MESKFFRINTIKVGEQDKYIITCGRYQAREEVFDSKEEAKQFLEETWDAQLEPYIICLTQAIKDYEEKYKKALESIKNENKEYN